MLKQFPICLLNELELLFGPASDPPIRLKSVRMPDFDEITICVVYRSRCSTATQRESDEVLETTLAAAYFSTHLQYPKGTK